VVAAAVAFGVEVGQYSVVVVEYGGNSSLDD
jgi:hypothetical protein